MESMSERHGQCYSAIAAYFVVKVGIASLLFIVMGATLLELYNSVMTEKRAGDLSPWLFITLTVLL